MRIAALGRVGLGQLDQAVLRTADDIITRIATAIGGQTTLLDRLRATGGSSEALINQALEVRSQLVTRLEVLSEDLDMLAAGDVEGWFARAEQLEGEASQQRRVLEQTHGTTSGRLTKILLWGSLLGVGALGIVWLTAKYGKGKPRRRRRRKRRRRRR